MNKTDVIHGELVRANKMLDKYESKALEGSTEQVVTDGLQYWRGVAQQMRTHLLDEKLVKDS